jgi:mannose/fructose/N-acetylgalactosamine-specific phosphotransferase system component IIC
VSPLQIVLVLVAGALVGVDLASVPQAMIARPLVAGCVGGLIMGNPLAGLTVGVLCELFALETLPVGAARYPDWGPGTVATGALAGAHDGGMMASGLLGLVLVSVLAAQAGGWLVHVMRRSNVAAAARHRADLEAGDVRAVRAMQWHGLRFDLARSAVLAALTLGVGDLLSSLFAREWGGPERIAQVALVATSSGVALLAGWRLAGHDRHGAWIAAGLAAGSLVMVL